ncbi:MAG: hypothetical protein O7F12_07850 [Nitrospirae bacterium]|nr:hypothetical protein [Nitrospirota bacterium]
MVGLWVFGFTSLLWGVIGVVMTAVPQLWANFIHQTVEDDWKRFWLTQTMILVGLVLTIGTAQFQGTLVWMVFGVVLVVKACVLLGAGSHLRTRLLNVMSASPLWAYRCGGVMMLTLAVFLATDVILHG